jgi:hypothetical protein
MRAIAAEFDEAQGANTEGWCMALFAAFVFRLYSFAVHDAFPPSLRRSTSRITV